jgi:hypothetical protein
MKRVSQPVWHGGAEAAAKDTSKFVSLFAEGGYVYPAYGCRQSTLVQLFLAKADAVIR